MVVVLGRGEVKDCLVLVGEGVPYVFVTWREFCPDLADLYIRLGSVLGYRLPVVRSVGCAVSERARRVVPYLTFAWWFRRTLDVCGVRRFVR